LPDLLRMKPHRIAPVLVALALAACAASPPPKPQPLPTPQPLPPPKPLHNPLAQWRPSPNHDPRNAVMIVLHQTEMESAEAALLTLQTRNLGGRVSAHYLIGGDGVLYQLVDETERAWHAGASRWGGVSDLNSASIGIEIDNDGVEPFTEAQIATLLRLLGDITWRLDIPKHLVIGHGDIAPVRKRDPSALFPWKRLADAGYGLWPRVPLAPPPPGFDAWAAMRLVGYDLRDPEAALRAFHRHYRGNEASQWLPGDAEILFDLQKQLMDMPEPAVVPITTPSP
jgi:N-acetylmuramoyl-L-alanine amidase